MLITLCLLFRLIDQRAGGEVGVAAVLEVRAVVIDRAADCHLAAGAAIAAAYAAVSTVFSCRDAAHAFRDGDVAAGAAKAAADARAIAARCRDCAARDGDVAAGAAFTAADARSSTARLCRQATAAADSELRAAAARLDSGFVRTNGRYSVRATEDNIGRALADDARRERRADVHAIERHSGAIGDGDVIAGGQHARQRLIVAGGVVSAELGEVGGSVGHLHLDIVELSSREGDGTLRRVGEVFVAVPCTELNGLPADAAQGGVDDIGRAVGRDRQSLFTRRGRYLAALRHVYRLHQTDGRDVEAGGTDGRLALAIIEGEAHDGLLVGERGRARGGDLACRGIDGLHCDHLAIRCRGHAVVVFGGYLFERTVLTIVVELEGAGAAAKVCTWVAEQELVPFRESIRRRHLVRVERTGERGGQAVGTDGRSLERAEQGEFDVVRHFPALHHPNSVALRPFGVERTRAVNRECAGRGLAAHRGRYGHGVGLRRARCRGCLLVDGVVVVRASRCGGHCQQQGGHHLNRFHKLLHLSVLLFV